MATEAIQPHAVPTVQVGGLVAFSKEVTAGTIAGIAQLLVGHPFDTIKVKMQAAAPGEYRGILDCARATIKQQGLLGVYRGMASPFFGSVIYNATLFSTNSIMKRLVAREGQSTKDLSVGQIMLAGAGTGAVVSIVQSPIELLKCQLQAEKKAHSSSARTFKGPLDLGTHMLRTRGPGFLTIGLGSTILREMPGNLFYFATYETVKKFFINMQGRPVNALETLLAGGLGGLAFWAAVYPMDFIKTKLQIQPVDQPPTYRGIFDCARKVSAAEGVRGLYKGFWPCMIRAFPANAVVFLVYERVRKVLFD